MKLLYFVITVVFIFSQEHRKMDEIPQKSFKQSFDDTTDGPPKGTLPSSTTQSEGPFTLALSKRPQSVQIEGQLRSKRVTKDGIVFKHTEYHPKPLDEKLTHYKTSAEYTSQIYSDNYYKMDSFPRGKLTLINVKYFTKHSKMDKLPRDGTDVDAEELTSLFLDMGFAVDRFDNPSSE